MQNLFSFQSNGDRTNYNRRFKSPVFSFALNTTVTANSTFLFDYHRDNLATEKYGSFNYCRVANTSTSEIIIYPNQNRNAGISVPAGTITTIDEQTVASTSSLLIENVGSSSITSNQVRIQVWKDRTDIQSIASNLHKRFFSNEPDPFTMKKSQITGGI